MKISIVGKWKWLSNPPRCGSSIAHKNCRFAREQMDCAADVGTYDACPYSQRGNVVADYREEENNG